MFEFLFEAREKFSRNHSSFCYSTKIVITKFKVEKTQVQIHDSIKICEAIFGDFISLRSWMLLSE
jgi:hypothetical protein